MTAEPAPAAIGRVTRLRIWLLEHLPTGFLARPFECFISFLCIVSGVSILAGVAEPRSVSALLPTTVYYVWGASLTVGGGGMACGLSSYTRTPGQRWTITRIPCYRLGLRLLGLASFLYVAAAFWFAGADAVPAITFPVAFVASCVVRLLTLGKTR